MSKPVKTFIMQQETWQSWEVTHFSKLEKELSELRNGPETLLVRLQLKLDLTRNVIEELNVDVRHLGFISDKEEILFMKHVRPKYYALHIYHAELLLTESNLPKTPGRQLLGYYQECVQIIDRYIQFNYALYQYFQLCSSEQDELYFLRTGISEATRHLLPVDIRSGTAVSDLFSHFIAYERLRADLIQRIVNMGCLHVADGWQIPFSGRRLKWTGSLINLIELVYGLYYTRQLNDGQASMRDITRLMEDVFQVELKHIFRRFAEIRRRKRLSPTHHLDQMREEILKLIDKDLAFKPKHRTRENREAKHG